MAIMYYLKDGGPPGNVTRTQDVTMSFVTDEFFGCKKKYLSPLAEGLPPINPENGPASPDSDPMYIVIKVPEAEAGPPEFERSGYYLVEGVGPWM